MGEFLLDWEDARGAPDPHAHALQFAQAVFRHASALGEWDEGLASSIDDVPLPPLRQN